ncbi:retrotransposon protein, putative, ty1-copia subclass [Tanacetum coccineum]
MAITNPTADDPVFNSLITQEESGSLEDLEIIQEKDTHPSLDTSLNHEEDDQEIDEPQSDINPIRRSTRTRHAPDRMCLYIDAKEHETGDLGEPANYKAALLDPESDKWLNVMNVEMQSMKDNEVWELVDLPPDGKTVGHKWLFKKKTDMDGAVHTYKARLQMDVKTVFLNGYLNEELYMEQLEGFVNQKFPNQVCKLKRFIYGLKQTSSQWNKRFDDEIKKFGFSQNRDEPCVYVKASGSYVTFLILYVDDILIMENNIPMLQDVKSYLGRCFAMKYLEEATYILGIEIYRDRSKCTRPDVAFAQNITSRFQHNPGEVHWTAVKNILKYLRNTKDMFLVYGGDTKRELRVSCYTDAGYLTDADDMKSQTGYVFVLNGGVVDWKSTKQSIFATSSTDAEYIAAFDASKEAVWIRKFISGLGVVPTIEEPINMYCDNTGAIAIAKDHGVTKGARHFRAKVHYLRETIEMGDVFP